MLATRSLPLLGLLLLLAACGDDDAPVTGPVELKVHLAPGTVIKFKSTSSSEGRSPKFEGKTKNSEDGREFEIAVKEVDASGVASGVYRWTHLWGRYWGLGPEMKFDSKADAQPPDPMLKFQIALEGKELPFKVAPTGEVQPVEGMAARVQGWFQGSPEAGILEGPVGESFSDAAMRMMVQQALPPLPPKPLKVGETWPVRMNLPPDAGVEILYEGTGTLKAATASTATLHLEGTISAVPLPTIDPEKATPDELRRRMVPRPVISNASLVIESKLSRADGLILEQTAELKMHLSIKMYVEQPSTEVDHMSRTKQERISR